VVRETAPGPAIAVAGTYEDVDVVVRRGDGWQFKSAACRTTSPARAD